eukprot:314761-Lingulodinium_polyedra.AAC.1
MLPGPCSTLRPRCWSVLLPAVAVTRALSWRRPPQTIDFAPVMLVGPDCGLASSPRSAASSPRRLASSLP